MAVCFSSANIRFKTKKAIPYVSGFSLYLQQPVSHKVKSISVMNRMVFIIRIGFYLGCPIAITPAGASL
ncbi:hypothetical protein HMPREF1551_01078 [Capnocytophaga sp. oral taxon 863 str. F0517]|nr:hypothetical protein HMPREF1551_01078 [Capnocytophaga sp. oral taxon 863 str. F0517]